MHLSEEWVYRYLYTQLVDTYDVNFGTEFSVYYI
jgi:hypothetical protein